jgi:leucyl aminopeptidase
VSTLNLSTADAAKTSTDALVVGITCGSDGPQLASGSAGIDAALGGRLLSVLRTVGATGKPDELTKIGDPGKTKAKVIVVVGLGEAPAKGGLIPTERLRSAAGAATRSLSGTSSVAVALPADTVEEAVAVAEGALLGAYAYTRYQTRDGAAKAPVGEISVLSRVARDKATKAGVERAQALAEAVSLARDLVNTPASDLHPADFADIAKASFKGVSGVTVEVLDEKALLRGGYGGILGVGQGSVDPPRLVRIAYSPGRARRGVPHLALVGKGITFDSGGLSIKPADGMITMKCDMSGAAAVLGAMLAIARTKPEVRVTAYACLAENMPSGTAIRPSDVLTMYGGRTVEVLNTDAEGRLVLGDGIARASEDKPDLIVDVATLTGACMVALGERIAGVMSTSDHARDAVGAAAERAGEQMWPLPLPVEMKAKLESSIADMTNVGNRMGGALTAGLFLSEFVGEGIEWAHVDIAGPAFTDKPYGYTPKGGTGFAVRTLVALAEDMAAQR